MAMRLPSEIFRQALPIHINLSDRRESPSMSYIRLVKKGLKNPGHVPDFVRIRLLMLFRNIFQAPYIRRTEGRFPKREVNGYDMMLDINDKGLSREILYFGERESQAKNIFKKELEVLTEEVDGDILSLEIGANIGYYALLEADVLGESAHILATEPSPAAAELLRKNFEMNNFQDRITITECAIGNKTGTIEFGVNEHLNLSKIVDTSDSNFEKSSYSEIVDVEMYDGEEYLREMGYEPSDVNLIRMDVQGAEYEVLQSLESVLESDSPTLVFIETHSIKRNKMEWIAETLRNNGYEESNITLKGMDLDISRRRSVNDFNVKKLDELPDKTGHHIVRNY